MDALRRSAFVRELMEGRLALAWAPTRMVSDDPAKGLGLTAPGALLPQKLEDIIGEPAAEVALVSAYFVPGAAGADELGALAQRGVRVRVLTNSLEAMDVAVVHTSYAKRRKFLLEAGVTLYEFRRLSPDTGPNKSASLWGGGLRQLRFGPARQNALGGSCARIHQVVQFRSAFGKAEHQNGFCHRQPGIGAEDRRRVR
jgi:putative cardiolipin synthase